MTYLRLVWSSNGRRRCRSNPNPSDVMRLFKEMGATRRQLPCGTAERATGVVGRLTISRGSGLLNTTIMDEVTAQLTRRLSAHLSLLSRCWSLALCALLSISRLCGLSTSLARLGVLLGAEYTLVAKMKTRACASGESNPGQYRGRVL